MIIKEIELKNIRSFEEVKIQFNKGSTLLAGDIGSGKTSILMAIEFGLFGLQPGQRGSALLRNGENEAKVKLHLDISGKDVIIERSLKKNKSVTQNYAAITIDGQREELSIMEIKQKVLNLLNYPAEFSKKQNILYKFTIYTPQEEMKEIITQDTQTRLNTLRHIFGIDKYKTVTENLSILKLKLREDKRAYELITKNLDEEKEQIKKQEEELNEKKQKIILLEHDDQTKRELREKKENE